MEEKKGRDEGYMQADGTLRPIREVLDEQKRNHNAQEKALREAAFRERAKQQSLLATCLCCYPLTEYPTASRHAAWCPSEGMHQSFEAVRAERERRIRESTP